MSQSMSVPTYTHSDDITAVKQVCIALATQMQQQQQLLQQLISTLSGSREATATETQEVRSDATLHPALIDSPRSASKVPRTFSLASALSAQAVPLFASQIPEYGDTENENVETKVKRIERVTVIHATSEGVIFLAATSKLTAVARR